MEFMVFQLISYKDLCKKKKLQEGNSLDLFFNLFLFLFFIFLADRRRQMHCALGNPVEQRSAATDAYTHPGRSYTKVGRRRGIVKRHS